MKQKNGKSKLRRLSYETYQDRNNILLEMGFKTYNGYLASDLWKSIRNRIPLDRCRICNKTPAEVHHHDSYKREVLDGTDISRIHPLCKRCHHRLEFKGDGKKDNLKKRTLREVQIIFWRATRPKVIENRKSKKIKKETNRKLWKCDICKKNWAKRGKTYCTPCKQLVLRNERIINKPTTKLDTKKIVEELLIIIRARIPRKS